VLGLYFGLRPLFRKFIKRQEEAEQVAVVV
jgi:hypothetical protein